MDGFDWSPNASNKHNLYYPPRRPMHPIDRYPVGYFLSNIRYCLLLLTHPSICLLGNVNCYVIFSAVTCGDLVGVRRFNGSWGGWDGLRSLQPLGSLPVIRARRSLIPRPSQPLLLDRCISCLARLYQTLDGPQKPVCFVHPCAHIQPY